MADTKISNLSAVTAAEPTMEIAVAYAGGNYKLTAQQIADLSPGAPSDMLSTLVSSEVSITGTTTLTGSAFGKMHVCSGTTSNYTVTLPAVSGNAGKLIGFRMASGLTRLVTLDGNASETIDGATSRVLWALESAVLYCDGSAWTKISGRTVPFKLTARRAVTQTVPNVTWTAIVMDTVIVNNSSAIDASVQCWDSANGRFRAPRPGTYQSVGFATIDGLTTGNLTFGGVAANSATPGDNPNAFMMMIAPALGNVQVTASGPFDIAANDFINTICFQASGSSQNTRASATVYPTLAVVEIPSW